MRSDEPGSRLYTAITEATARALREAAINLPADVVTLIQAAFSRESSPAARGELENILENVRVARENGVPLCQDTGVPVIYVTLPPDHPYNAALFDAVADGVRQATREVPLRPNVVSPLMRENTGDNTGLGMPLIHTRPGERLTITVLPKGAGSENVSRVVMLLPSQRGDISRVVSETVLIAGGRPCPPVIIGVGIGGTFDGAAALAKEALLEPIDTMDPFERGICATVNKLGIGPMGLGGDTTALAVKVKIAGCHTASLPVAVNIQCWAGRRATVEVVL
jgi:fumarate hydratase subunit alpha